MKITKILGSVIAVALLFAGTLYAGTTTIPDSALSSSPGVYTAGGYFTNSLGSIVVTTGGGNANNAGDPSGRNDDGYSGPVALPFAVNLFGNTYNQFWINNNGNVSFSGGISSYTPSGPTGSSVPIISPFFGDVDTRNTASGVVMYNQVSADQVVVTWNAVGYYDTNADKLDSFQLVLNNPSAVPAGEGSIGFFYEGMGWETGDASGGSGGFGGTPAAVGFGDGLGNAIVLAGSIQNGISGIVNNQYIWFNVTPGGIPTPVTHVPEPASLLLLGSGLLALVLKRKAMLKV